MKYALATLLVLTAAPVLAADLPPQQLIKSTDIISPGLYRVISQDTATIVYMAVDGAGKITDLEAVPFGLLPADAVERLKALPAAK